MTWQDRVQLELEELQIKLQKLRTFLDSEESEKIDPGQLELLQAQEIAMDNYADILFERLHHG
jgi:hypothetical protein